MWQMGAISFYAYASNQQTMSEREDLGILGFNLWVLLQLDRLCFLCFCSSEIGFARYSNMAAGSVFNLDFWILYVLHANKELILQA